MAHLSRTRPCSGMMTVILYTATHVDSFSFTSFKYVVLVFFARTSRSCRDQKDVFFILRATRGKLPTFFFFFLALNLAETNSFPLTANSSLQRVRSDNHPASLLNNSGQMFDIYWNPRFFSANDETFCISDNKRSERPYEDSCPRFEWARKTIFNFKQGCIVNWAKCKCFAKPLFSISFLALLNLA